MPFDRALPPLNSGELMKPIEPALLGPSGTARRMISAQKTGLPVV